MRVWSSLLQVTLGDIKGGSMGLKCQQGVAFGFETKVFMQQSSSRVAFRLMVGSLHLGHCDDSFQAARAIAVDESSLGRSCCSLGVSCMTLRL
jgi:hypothetical protein